MNGIALPQRRGSRLAPAGKPVGVSCDENGPCLGPVRLLRKTFFGFVPRPTEELDFVFTKALGAPVDWQSRMPDLQEIAQALDEKNLALAMIMTLHLHLPELSESAGKPREKCRGLAEGWLQPGRTA